VHGRISDYIRRNAIACVALFFALTGGAAWATHPGGADTISSGDIINSEVRNKDIAENAIGTNKIVNGAVRSADVLDGDLTDAEIANDEDGDFNDEGQDDVSADRLAGIEEEDFVYASPSLSTNPPNSIPGLRWRGFFLNTQQSDDDLVLASNRIVVENVGTADQFRVCNAFPAGNPPEAVVVWVGTSRTDLDLPGATCSSNFTIPDDGDFRVSGNRMQAWGVYSGNIEDLYLLFVLASA
jgi:hypothetical protein